MPAFWWYQPAIALTLLGGAATTLAADSGSYAVTGTAADAKVTLPADSGAYSITGTAATTFKSIILSAVTGTYSVGGTPVSFGKGYPRLLDASFPTHFVDATDSGFGNGNWSPTPSGACRASGDYDLIVIESPNTDVVVVTANGFTEHPASPISVSGADSIVTRLTIFERLWNGTDGSPVFDDPVGSSDHFIGAWMVFRPAPYLRWTTLAEVRSVYATDTEATADTSGAWPGIVTSGTNSLVVGVVAAAENGLDNQMSGITNNSGEVSGITEVLDAGRQNGGIPDRADGNIAAWFGKVPIAGSDYLPVPKSIGTTTFTWGVATSKALFIVELKAGIHNPNQRLKASEDTQENGTLNVCSNGQYFTFGTAVTFLPRMPAAGGTYSLTGSDATLIFTGGTTTLAADPGAYAVAGTAADAGDIVMPAASGSYALTGSDATLTFSPGGATVMPAAAGSYAVTGSDATLRRSSTKDWTGMLGDARHWRFFGRYRRGMRTGTIH